MTIKALSVKQPWASLIVYGFKKIETRTWKTERRGPLLIVSSKKPDELGFHYVRASYPDLLTNIKISYGQAIGLVDLIDIEKLRPEEQDKYLCPYDPRLYGWRFENPIVINPFPVKGKLQIYDVNIGDNAQIKDYLNEYKYEHSQQPVS